MANPLFAYWYRLSAYPTGPEEALEPAIAALGERYRAQHLFAGLKHIADFALLDRKIIIEVDGDSHLKPLQMEKDLKHTMALQALGWTVFRCSNEQAKANPEGVVRASLRAVQTNPQDLEAALAQLHRDYPKLLAPKAKRPRLKQPRRRG